MGTLLPYTAIAPEKVHCSCRNIDILLSPQKPNVLDTH